MRIALTWLYMTGNIALETRLPEHALIWTCAVSRHWHVLYPVALSKNQFVADRRPTKGHLARAYRQ